MTALKIFALQLLGVFVFNCKQKVVEIQVINNQATTE
jgi:hypothetical protein